MQQARRAALAAILIFVLLSLACGPGWDGYSDDYSEVESSSPTGDDDDDDSASDDDTGDDDSGDDDDDDVELWEGDQTVFVELADDSVEVALNTLPLRDYLGVDAVLLSELVEAGALADDPTAYRYDFTATDGYNLYVKREEDLSLLPSWDEMLGGYLYWDTRFDDLTAGWTEHPWGSAESAYQVKYMNGGTITLLPE